MLELFLGGARSGKSTLAEQRCIELRENTGKKLFYIATATAGDSEMQQRIALHQQQRSDQPWQSIEEPIYLAERIAKINSRDSIILLDCLTLWYTNLLMADDDILNSQLSQFLEIVEQLECHLILVSNEVGLGVVPMDKLSRRFVDDMGRLHQQLAACAQRVTFVAAGLPLLMKDDVVK